MIARYENTEIAQIWSKQNQLEVWTKIEILVAKYWTQSGLISQIDFAKISKVKPDLKRLQTIEKSNAHEFAAFVEMLANQVGKSGKWIHYGLTSNDVLDTSQNYLLKQSAIHLKGQLNKLLALLQKKAHQEKHTLCLGRTHGVVAEPITLGYKFALWFQEMQYHLQRLTLVAEDIDFVKILGPSGMSSHFPLALGEFVGKHLQMQTAVGGTQLFGRYPLITFFDCLTNLAVSVEKMAIEIRNLHRSEINEVKEGFVAGQKGSSAMPHKQNPIFCENICGLARLLKAMRGSFQSTNLLWHERDLTNSAIERVAIPDFLHLLATLLARFENVLTHLKINHHQIATNLKKYQDDLFSHKIMLLLLKRSDLDRNQAYALVQKSSFTAKTNKSSFMETLIANGILKYVSLEELKKCFDVKTFLVNIDSLFQHIFSKF